MRLPCVKSSMFVLKYCASGELSLRPTSIDAVLVVDNNKENQMAEQQI